MAWFEHARLGLLLRNEKTFEKIVEFLEPDFLLNLFRPYMPEL